MSNTLSWFACLFTTVALTCSCHTPRDGQGSSAEIPGGVKAVSSLPSDHSAPKTSKLELLVELSKKDGKSGSTMNGHGLFYIPYPASTENNLQVVGRQGNTCLLAALEAAPSSTDIFWIKIWYLTIMGEIK